MDPFERQANNVKDDEVTISKVMNKNAGNKVSTARLNLFLLTLLTILNIGCLVLAPIFEAKSTPYYLFSATIPYYVSRLGIELKSINIVFPLLGLLLTLPYVLCFIFYKKHYAWIIISLVYFSIDSAFYLYNFYLTIQSGANVLNQIFDILFHIFALYCFIVGAKYGKDYVKR